MEQVRDFYAQNEHIMGKSCLSACFSFETISVLDIDTKKLLDNFNFGMY
jgi:hypothetical protein